MTRTEATDLINTYCDDPAPAGAVDRLLPYDYKTFSVDGQVLNQDQLDSVIYGDAV